MAGGAGKCEGNINFACCVIRPFGRFDNGYRVCAVLCFGGYGKGGGGDNCGVGCAVAAVKCRCFDGCAVLCIITVGVRNYVAVRVLPFYKGVSGVGGVAASDFGGGVAT